MKNKETIARVELKSIRPTYKYLIIILSIIGIVFIANECTIKTNTVNNLNNISCNETSDTPLFFIYDDFEIQIELDELCNMIDEVTQ